MQASPILFQAGPDGWLQKDSVEAEFRRIHKPPFEFSCALSLFAPAAKRQDAESSARRHDSLLLL